MNCIAAKHVYLREDRQAGEALRLGEAQHKVHVLYSLAARTLHQVVDRRHENGAPGNAVSNHVDETIVTATNVSRLWCGRSNIIRRRQV